MNIWDILIIALVVLLLVLAVLNRRRKKGCCGDCSGCDACAAGGKTEQAEGLEELQGAWEPKGYIGPRVEIEEERYTQLWQAAPVLETRFRTEREGQRLSLRLERDGLRYAGSEKDYARVKAVWLEGGALTVLEDFPITGESSDTLYPTQNSRYGNATVADAQVFPLLEGDWVSPDTELRLRFRDGQIAFAYGEEPVESAACIALRPNGAGPVELRDRDPAVKGLGMFGRMTLEGDTILAYLYICDGPTRELRFQRAD